MKKYLILALIIPFSTYADVYQCKDSKGKVVFSDTPCSNDAKIISTKYLNSINVLSQVKLIARIIFGQKSHSTIN